MPNYKNEPCVSWQIHRPNCLKIFQLQNKVAKVETKVITICLTIKMFENVFIYFVDILCLVDLSKRTSVFPMDGNFDWPDIFGYVWYRCQYYGTTILEIQILSASLFRMIGCCPIEGSELT